MRVYFPTLSLAESFSRDLKTATSHAQQLQPMVDRRTLTRLTPSVLSQSLSSTMPALLTRIFNEPYSLTVDLNVAEEKWYLYIQMRKSKADRTVKGALSTL